MAQGFLPVTKKELLETGVSQPDFVYVVGDAYVDHPSFGAAIISRLLESQGYSVAMLPQPDWRSTKDIMRFGKPKLAFLVTGGNIDSMVAHYTAAKRKRSQDSYSPGGKAGLRPDRAVITYCQCIRRAYPDAVIAIGGLEASLRRFAHYDYWSDTVRPSILVETDDCPQTYCQTGSHRYFPAPGPERGELGHHCPVFPQTAPTPRQDNADDMVQNSRTHPFPPAISASPLFVGKSFSPYRPEKSVLPIRQRHGKAPNQ